MPAAVSVVSAAATAATAVTKGKAVKAGEGRRM